jgi:D-alanyl-lipoteichoic acid acyltransferase DltB (MBOAT superfamily)
VSLLFSTIVYWTIPRSQWRFRALFLTVMSVALVSLMVPSLGLFLIGSTVVAHAYKRVRQTNASFWVAAIFVLAQIALMIAPDLADMSRLSHLFTFVGMTYFTLRNIGYIIDLYKGKTQPDFIDILFLNAFFPTYSAGPIENIKTVRAASCDVGFDAAEIQMGLVRILVGILKFYLVSGTVLKQFSAGGFPQTLAAIEAAPSGMVVAMTLVNWLTLYISFSGYADIAIGSSKLFGIHIRENFNFPFLASNIQIYWQRWNISVMNFVSEYVYLNFVRKTGWRTIGIYLVFLAMGMWHRVSPNYVIWAIAHGSAMSLLVLVRRRRFYQQWQQRVAASPFLRLPVMGLGWALTMVFVSVVSAVGTAPDLAHGLAVLRALLW